MNIRIQSTGELVSEQGFRALHPNTSLPQQLTETIINDMGGDVVFEGPQATGGTVYQYSQRAGVEQIEGKWYTKYILGPVFTDRAATEDEPAKTAAEQEAEYKAMKDAEQAKSVRTSRGEKLKDSDWTQIADSTADKALWATYRQALRDVTAQAGFPWTVEWPETP
jgi:hypothetical protein